MTELAIAPSKDPEAVLETRPGCSAQRLRASRIQPLGAGLSLYKTTLSPLLHAFSPTQCLYLPTCSEYAYVAWSRFGPIRGSWLAFRRLLRCHPLAKGGFDPVPQPSPGKEHLP